MEIKGLDYNTKREKLIMSEYGREVQKMVEVAAGLTTKEERMRCAKSIVRLMENKNPQVRQSEDYQQTLWDHLYLMSAGKLDIDWPYDVSGAEKIMARPQPMAHPTPNTQTAAASTRHYGRLLTEVTEKLKEMPEGKERDELTRLTANQMKRDLVAWGHGATGDEKVADDLARLTDGRIQIDPAKLHLERATASPEPGNTGGKRKRKK